MSPGPSRTRPSDSLLGVRCTRCQRHLVGDVEVRRTVSGRWRHESCAAAPEPTSDDFSALADLLMHQHPWPRVAPLLAQLDEVLARLETLRGGGSASPVPRQAGPPSAEEVPAAQLERERALTSRAAELHEAIASERAWKARRLATEWADGH